MAAKKDESAVFQANARRESAMGRRAAQLAALSSQQADLKREAAERQARRDRDARSKAPSSGPRKSARRGNAR